MSGLCSQVFRLGYDGDRNDARSSAKPRKVELDSFTNQFATKTNAISNNETFIPN